METTPMTLKTAKERAQKFLMVRSIPDVAGLSDCLAELLLDVYRDGMKEGIDLCPPTSGIQNG